LTVSQGKLGKIGEVVKQKHLSIAYTLGNKCAKML